MRDRAPGDALDLSRLSPTLSKDASGIWVTGGAARPELSFPAGGHDACFDLEDRSFWFQHRSACIAEALARAPFEGALLDVGGGNGAVSAALEERGVVTVMLEPGAEGARNAKKRGLPNVVCATLDQAAFAPGSFGAVGLFDVIEHVEDDAALLRSAHRVLRPGGTLAVTVPAYGWLWSREDEVAGHFRRYTLRRLLDVLARASFDVTYATYFFAPLTAPVFFARSMRHWLSRGRAAEAAEASAARQHSPSPLAARAARALLAPEIRAIARGRTIPFGTSCLAVARQRSDRKTPM